MANALLDRWVTVPNTTLPIASGRVFDLAFGRDQLPVLAHIDPVNHTLHLKKWDGRAWTSVTSLNFPDAIPARVRMAHNWASDIVVGLLCHEMGGTRFLRVYQLNCSQLGQLGPTFFPGLSGGFDVTTDARGAVVACQADGFVTVRRWDGANWAQLGGNLNETSTPL